MSFPEIELPEPMQVGVQVHITQTLPDGQEIDQVRFVKLDEGFHEVPLPGDLIVLVGADRRVVPSSVGPLGSLHVSTETRVGVHLEVRLEVQRRMWQAPGVVLICTPFPERDDQDAVAIIEVLEKIGFDLG